MKKRWKFLAIFAALGVAAVAVFCLLRVMPAPARERIYAHRGASGEAEEHSFEAYDLAIDCGVNHIEQDVVLSKDGTLYVSHDLTAQRLAGVDRPFSEMTDGEIEALVTVGGKEFLTLQEVFSRYKEKKNITFVVEVKDKAAADAFIALVKAQRLQRRCIVQSIDLTVLKKAKLALPMMRTLYLAKDQKDFEITLSQYYIDIMSLPLEHCSRENVAAAHKYLKRFNTWTANTDEGIARAIKAGADSYFTNYPKKALELQKNAR